MGGSAKSELNAARGTNLCACGLPDTLCGVGVGFLGPSFPRAGDLI